MQNNMEYESIWADGCPEHVDDKDKLKPEELHAMAIDYVLKNILLKKGFKLEQGFPRKEFPNIVCKKDDKIYAIVVFPSVYPNFVALKDEFRLNFVKMAYERNCIPLYAPVGYKSIDEERANAQMMLKGDVFLTTCPGFIVLNDEEHQNQNVKQEELFRP